MSGRDEESERLRAAVSCAMVLERLATGCAGVPHRRDREGHRKRSQYLACILLGGLSDYFGRKRVFIAEMIIFCAVLTLLLFTTGFLFLAICLVGLGMALGCDYPTAHTMISESIPSSARGKLVLGAFAFQAVAPLAGTGVGCLVLVLVPQPSFRRYW